MGWDSYQQRQSINIHPSSYICSKFVIVVGVGLTVYEQEEVVGILEGL
jgi:hypothetical protein